VWHARIFPRGGNTSISDDIDRHEPHLADALLAAVDEAERRGWATVRPALQLHAPSVW
jgi:hypothetical protein